ncbi:MAG TPA: deoxyribonuclease IV [Candidatus Limnocylindrales bacterium]|jgi:deoxyribonuclease-4
MLPDRRRLGAHLAMGDGLIKAADRAAEIGATALQIFTDNPTAWRRRAEPSPEIPAFREHLATSGIAPLAIHASYLINLAGANPADHERSVALLAAELVAARMFGAALVNVHIGSHGGAGLEAGIVRVVEAIRGGLEREAELAVADPVTAEARPATITLENTAGGGTGIGTSLDELDAIAAAVDGAGLPSRRIAFCLDTAHAWGAGYDLSDPAAIDGLLEDFDRRIGIDRLPLVHLNDSRSELGSRLDRHEHVGAGRIGEVGMAHVLRHPLLIAATFVLETPGMDDGYDAINVARAVALARGEALEPLPSGAFTLRGSRARAATPVDPALVDGSPAR